MSDKTYDVLKFVALAISPLIVLLSALCTIWNVPHAEAWCATLAAIDTFVGAVVLVAKKIWDKNNTVNSQ